MHQGKCGRYRVLRWLLAAWLCLAAGSVFLIPETLVVDANYVSLIPLLGCAAILLADKRGFAAFYCDRRTALLSALAGLILLLMLPIGHLFPAPSANREELARVAIPYLDMLAVWYAGPYPAAVTLSVLGCACYLLCRPCDAQAEAALGTASRIPRALPFCIIAAGSLLCTLSLYPACLFFPDQSTVWEDILARNWDDWHTIGYLMFTYLCTRPVRSAYMVVLVQTGMWLMINAYILRLFERLGFPRRAKLLYAALLTLLFTPYIYLWMLLKDTVFAMCLLGFSASLTAALFPESCRKVDYVVLGLCGLGVCLFRHAGVVPVLAGGIAVLAVQLNRRKTLKRHLLRTAAALCGAVLLFTGLRSGVGFGLLHAKQNPGYIAFGTPMGLMCGLVAKGAVFDPEDEAILTQVMPMEKWAACYDPYWVDPSAREYGSIGSDINKLTELHLEDELLLLNAKYLLRYPKLYLTALLDYSTIVWEISRPRYIEEWAPTGDMAGAQTDRYQVTFLSAYSLTNGYTTALYRSPLGRTFAWRGGVWTCALLLCALRFIRRRKSALLAALAPVATVTALLMLTVPCPDPRFILPVMECGMFFLVFTCLFNQKPTMKGAFPCTQS